MMRAIKLFALILCVLSLILAACMPKEKAVLRFATTPEYPPFSYKTGEVIEGIEPELIRKIADKMGMKYQLEAMSFDSLFAALASDKVDAAIASITITPQRSQQLDFSSPYYTTNQAIVSRSDSPLAISNVEDLGKYTIGTLRNTTGHLYIVEHLLDKDLMPKKNFKLYGTILEAVGEMLAGNLDFVIIDETAAIGYSKQKPIKVAFLIKTNESYGIAMQKGKALNEKINKALNELIASGEVKRITDSYLKR